MAFQNTPHTEHTERFIVAALRRAGALTISHVAERDANIIGRIAISPVRVTDGSAEWFGLGPISILPEHQGQGVWAHEVRALSELARISHKDGQVWNDCDMNQASTLDATARVANI